MDSPSENGISDDHNGEADSSDTPSTPGKSFEPAFTVKVTEAVKNGDAVLYTVCSKEVTGDTPEVTVSRQFEDFEWLQHCLMIKDNVAGVIFPPLPPKPIVDSKSAEKQTKKQLGKDAKVLMGDTFVKDCRSIEKYLKLVVNHPELGSDNTLRKFLTEEEAPVRTKVKQGLLTKLSSAVSRKDSKKDIEEYFQKERDWVNDYAVLIKEMSSAFNKVVYAEQRLSVAHSHLSASLNSGGAERDDDSTELSKSLVKFSEAIEDMKHSLDVDIINNGRTLGFQLELYARFLQSAKDMLHQRTSLLIQYEDANRAFDKAKPQKKDAAEQAKQAAETAFESCSDIARSELKRFHQARIYALQEGLVKYADAKIKTSRDTYALLAKSLTALKQLDSGE
ncbi:sorting nexin-5 [Lingula anatina]|uniref:Sorting nexin-5 n=1 Tax=Lingula anatina TaxID=7574 RepID=A0A1S3K9L8_LINAN|nr:sorting nexin-5 [Lingula anatina]|eukprot:XP_013419192.1 sorting nexin-5 [Lingula anatina]